MNTQDSDRSWPQWYPANSELPEIEPAKAMLQDAESFLGKQVPRLGKHVRSELDAMLHHDNRTVQSTTSNPDVDLMNSLSSLPLQQLSSYVESESKKMRDADEVLKQKRSRGLRKRATQVQDFAITFSQFLQAYSGIVSIVQLADAQYGNVASAALSLFFATVRAKAQAEESIHRCMLQISDRLPDYKSYAIIYPDPKLGAMLAEAYRDIIIFAREVTVYFQDHGFLRYIRHFSGSPEFQAMEQNMRDNSNRISTRCEVLLAQKINHLTQENQTVREFAKTLNLQNYPVEEERMKNLIEDQKILRHLFGNDRRRQKMDARDFLDTVDGEHWKGPGSMLMLLYGRNEKSSSNAFDSWLSLVAAELAQEYIESDMSAAYERCSKSSTLQATLSQLIYQFLEKAPSLIRQPTDYQRIDEQISRKGDQDETAEALRKALSHIINLHAGRVYIVLNRPDLCEHGPDESCLGYIKTMLSLVKEATVELKIMMVLKSEWWDYNSNRKGIDTRGLDPNLFRLVELDQKLART
ncbi:hypothetical protein F5Y18DRAFT_434935 [Xylariaceae sp. FL1019]|nr:hypothetical protein F5Y18DRAFT_434935 [Xylariaceae sp. FL1019]